MFFYLSLFDKLNVQCDAEKRRLDVTNVGYVVQNLLGKIRGIKIIDIVCVLHKDNHSLVWIVLNKITNVHKQHTEQSQLHIPNKSTKSSYFFGSELREKVIALHPQCFDFFVVIHFGVRAERVTKKVCV